MNVVAIVLAIVVTYLGSRWIEIQKKERSDNMRRLAKAAMEQATGLSVSKLSRDEKFIERCAKLSGSAKEKIQARANSYAALETRDSKRLKYYLPRESEKLFACQLVSLLTDLPPHWIYDCGTNRKGLIPQETPGKNAQKVPRRTNVSAIFFEEMKPGTLNTSTFQLAKNASTRPVPASVDYDEATKTVTLTPSSKLARRTLYIAKISGARDQEGNTLADKVWSFTTGNSP